MFTVYILHSSSLNKYYVGQTAKLDDRIIKHNSGGVQFTSKGVPWKVVYEVSVETRSLAMQLEKKIKKRGAKRYLEDIKFGV